MNEEVELIELARLSMPGEAGMIKELLENNGIDVIVQGASLNNLMPGGYSETVLLVKPTRQAYPWLESAIKENHTYQTPEIIALAVEAGADDYLRWLSASLNTERTTA